MTKREEQPQPLDLDTGERMATTGRAVVEGLGRMARGEHEGRHATLQAADPAAVERIIAEWHGPPQNIARQMIEKYGPPNEATPTKLFWYENHPWKRTIVDRDTVQHNWPTVHTDFLTQVIDYRVPPDMFDEDRSVRWEHPRGPNTRRGGRALRLGGGERSRDQHGARDRHREADLGGGP